MSTNATQPSQAEGPREDDEPTKTGGQGVSAQEPAEGSDDDSPGGSDSPAAS